MTSNHNYFTNSPRQQQQQQDEPKDYKNVLNIYSSSDSGNNLAALSDWQSCSQLYYSNFEKNSTQLNDLISLRSKPDISYVSGRKIQSLTRKLSEYRPLGIHSEYAERYNSSYITKSSLQINFLTANFYFFVVV